MPSLNAWIYRAAVIFGTWIILGQGAADSALTFFGNLAVLSQCLELTCNLYLVLLLCFFFFPVHLWGFDGAGALEEDEVCRVFVTFPETETKTTLFLHLFLQLQII